MEINKLIQGHSLLFVCIMYHINAEITLDHTSMDILMLISSILAGLRYIYTS